MKLSTKGRYGVRLMIDLALHYGEGPVDLKAISKRQGISEKYLWHLIPPLKNAGLIHSVRGARGGYLLAHKPDQITLKDIVCLLEGSMSLVDCLSNPAACKRMQGCVTRDVWQVVTKKILETLESFTLEALAEKLKKKRGVFTYSI
ncbi:MAG TPA: Rrf2 family transcriptional regulator [Elusimicrobiota bacterium]|nr:Rrf2 family transcriptional regulator [Elusimicrobiota bacterium]